MNDNFKLWQEKVINPFLDSKEGQELKEKVSAERKTKKILPAPNEIFNAFIYTPIDNIKVVIVGLDPYNTGDHAHGLAFSSKKLNTPPSLRVIFKELRRTLYSHLTDDEWKTYFPHNNLTNWSKNGVFLINRYLTVEQGQAKSHKDIGWDTFMKDYVFKFLNEYSKPIVFMLWGNDAKETKAWINNEKHLILEGAHPAADLYNPANPKFYGCNHFSEAVSFLKKEREKDCSTIDVYIQKYFKEEMFDDIKKTIQANGLAYNYENDNHLLEEMKKSLILTYNYGIDFTLNN